VALVAELLSYAACGNCVALAFAITSNRNPYVEIAEDCDQAISALPALQHLLIGGGPIASSCVAATSTVRMTRSEIPTNASGTVFKGIVLPAKDGGWRESARPPGERRKR
jgi:hypothetical protein